MTDSIVTETASSPKTTLSQMGQDLYLKLSGLEARTTMLTLNDGFKGFQGLEENMQFSLLCDIAYSVSDCLKLADAIDDLL